MIQDSRQQQNSPGSAIHTFLAEPILTLNDFESEVPELSHHLKSNQEVLPVHLGLINQAQKEHDGSINEKSL